ncbi:hypothetical protein GCM10027088_39560 [Nocardia goodfellowii]
MNARVAENPEDLAKSQTVGVAHDIVICDSQDHETTIPVSPEQGEKFHTDGRWTVASALVNDQKNPVALAVGEFAGTEG